MEMSPSTILQKHCKNNSKKYKSSVTLLLVVWVKVAEPIKIIIEKLTIINNKRGSNDHLASQKERSSQKARGQGLRICDVELEG